MLRLSNCENECELNVKNTFIDLSKSFIFNSTLHYNERISYHMVVFFALFL